MQVVEHAINNWFEPTTLLFLGDLHLGAANVDEKLVEQVAQRIQGKNVYWIDLGDSINAINVSDWRWDPHALADWIEIADLIDLPKAEVSRYKHYFGHSGHNCLARLKGNHEDYLTSKYERDIYQELNNAIELDQSRALGYSGFIRLRFRYMVGEKVNRVWTQVLYIHHGASNGKLAGGKALNLERLTMGWEADIYAVGHSHTKLVLNKRIIAVQSKRNQIEDKQKIMINVGSFMDGTTGYAERKGLYPQSLGPVELQFFPQTKHVKVIQ